MKTTVRPGAKLAQGLGVVRQRDSPHNELGDAN